jgi:putative SOS response-associated peptidase YedK
LYSCTICTVDASETMLNVHIRMPVRKTIFVISYF